LAISRSTASQFRWTKAAADREQLVGEVVELEHQRIRLPAVGAWVVGEELEEERHAGSNDDLFPGADVVDVTLAVGRVVLLLVVLPAWSAEVVSLSFGLPPPSEVIHSLHFTATSALSEHIEAYHIDERAFESRAQHLRAPDHAEPGRVSVRKAGGACVLPPACMGGTSFVPGEVRTRSGRR
jgi:hypothetical protein